MHFIQAIKSCAVKYANPKGRAPRSEYWYWALFISIVSIALRSLDLAVFGIDARDPNAIYPLYTIWSFATLCPGIMVAIRRLHDTDRSGWWFLIVFTVIGVIPLIIWFCLPGTKGNNRFGADPLGQWDS